MGKHRKWFWISGLYDYKRDIVLNGMILSGTHCNYEIKVGNAVSVCLKHMASRGGEMDWAFSMRLLVVSR